MEKMPKVLPAVLLFVAAALFPSLPPLWAADEIVDAYTGANQQREAAETNSLFNVLRTVYRPNYNKKPVTSLQTQAPYERVAPPKWSYYGTKPKTEALPKKKTAVDGRYYKPKTEPEKKK